MIILLFKELFLIDKDIIIFDLINNGNKNYAVLVSIIVKKLFKYNTNLVYFKSIFTNF